MPHSTQQLRSLWSRFECSEHQMVVVPFGPDKIRVAPATARAWEALAAVLMAHEYRIRTDDTDSYNCRNIKGTNQKSLHSYGIALDVNWKTNPWIDHAGKRQVRFSDKLTQAERAEDVRHGLADTDMTEAMLDDALKIRTINGDPVFRWGGHYESVKDCMHFEICASPDELDDGIDFSTVRGWQAYSADSAASPSHFQASEVVELQTSVVPIEPATLVETGERYVVIARSGLNLRSGPGITFGTLRLCHEGAVVHVLSRDGDWALVDLQGDGKADGYMHAGFLKPAIAQGASASAPVPISSVALDSLTLGATSSDILGFVTPEVVSPMFPVTKKANIVANLPFVLAGLRARHLTDRPMALMALATIRAETEGFVPIPEGISKYNTLNSPFDLYDAGTEKGRDLGNVQPGDGPLFRGRGYVQLTGRDNYRRIGAQIGKNLIADPELANEPATAGLILAQFLSNKRDAIYSALSGGDLKSARKLVNGGSHGYDRFRDAYERGIVALPG